MAAAKEAFVPFKSVPGPPRLEMAVADNSGVVNTDPMFIADRLAIVNHCMAYAYLIDEGRWEEWYGLFADDFVFENSTPELGTVIIKGKDAFKEMINFRYIIPGKGSKTVRRHTQGNVHVAEQTATTAKVRTYMFISSVPAADHLHMLTTGTYNISLEKRNDRWTITRYYIEVDAPLSPSKLPEGFSEDEFKWIPDPSLEMPGAGPVAQAVKGKITLKDHPFSTPANGPLYQNAPIWQWPNAEIVIIDYLTDNNSAIEMLPEQVTTLPIAELPGYSAVKHIWAHYPESSFGPYDEFFVAIPCLFEGTLYMYVPFIYVNNDSACAGGREIGGWPKKMADISIDRVGGEFRCTIERRGKRFASGSMKVGGKLFSTPLPADKPITLSYPYNMTFPLPAPTGKEQEDVVLPSTSLKLFPGVDYGNSPSVARLISGPWRLKGTFSGGSNASIGFGKSDEDPVYRLPNLKTVGSMYYAGDMTLSLSEMTILDDMLKK